MFVTPPKKIKASHKIGVQELPLDLIFEVAKYLSSIDATRLLLTSSDLYETINDDPANSERWFAALVATNQPFLSHLSHPLLDTPRKKLSAYFNCCKPTTKIELERPDVTSIFVNCQVYLKVYESGGEFGGESGGETFACESCTLIHSFGCKSCEACGQAINYEEEILHETTTPLYSDCSFETPIEASAFKNIFAIFEEAAPNTEIQVRLCLFDSKTRRTFAPYNGSVDQCHDGKMLCSFEDLTISSSLTSHIQVLLECASLEWRPYLNLKAGSESSGGQLVVYGESDGFEGSLELLYLFSPSVEWSKASTSLKSRLHWHRRTSSGISQKMCVEAGRKALFALPPKEATTTDAVAKMALAELVNDVRFIVSISQSGGATAVYYHNALIPTLSNDFTTLQFFVPNFDDSLIECEEDGIVVEIVAVSSHNRMCQLVKMTLVQISPTLWVDEDLNESASESRWAQSLAGSALGTSLGNENGFTCSVQLSFDDDEWQLQYLITNHSVSTQEAPILNAFLQRSLDEGGTDF